MSIRIQFATDFVCPYCYAAEIPLQKAMQGRDDIEVELLPLELTPTSREPIDTYHDEIRRAKWSKDLVPFCNDLGLNAHFPPNVIPRPYTHLAWQGYHYANSKGKGIAYADAMYRAYFESEQDIGDLNVLSRIAGNLGLNQEEFCTTLKAGTYSEYQDSAINQTREKGVKSVPTIWINGLRLTGDLFTEEDFAFYLDLAAGGNHVSFGSDTGCGPDGC